MAAKHEPHTFMGDFRKFFGRGLAILLPSVLTLWILWQAAVFVFDKVARPINAGIRVVILEVTPRIVDERSLPAWFQVTPEEVMRYEQTLAQDALSPQDRSLSSVREEVRRLKFKRFWEDHWYLEATGLFVAMLLIYLAGLLLGNLLGRRLYARVERLIARIPGFKQVYPHVKQVVDLVMGERKMAFNRVVLVEYPRDGIWTIGLVTGNSLRSIRGVAGGEVLSVFIPTSPTPFTGFTINVLAKDAIDIPVSIDEAIRFVITAGVLVPDADRAPEDPVGKQAKAALAERERRAAEPPPGPPEMP